MIFPTVEEFKTTDYTEELLNKELESILDLLIWSKTNLKSNFIFVSKISDKAKAEIESKGFKIKKVKDQFKITY